jgi:multidrug efflux pump subunit AcrB
MTAEEFTKRWRAEAGQIVGADTSDFSYDIGPGSGTPVSIELRHEDTATLRAAATALADQLRNYDGVFDVNDGFQLGKEQLDMTLKPEARALGVTETDLARQVRGAFFGNEVARVQRGRDELKIYVRRPKDERVSEYDIENMLIRTPQGGEIPLDQAAHIERGRSNTEIDRESGGRVVDVTADVDEEKATGSEITANLQADVLPGLMERYPGLSYELSGQQQERQESLGALGSGFAFALLAMFALMAIAFRSYVQPLVVMAAIPFGIVGAVAGHMLMGFNLSLISMMGLVALSGVTVNDSLVLVSAINDFRDKGLEPLEAVTAGGARRFRPILLTSLTTFFGLTPMIFETSVQARFLIPMALSLGFGVLFVTVIALIIVPSLYLAVVDAKRMAQKVREALKT